MPHMNPTEVAHLAKQTKHGKTDRLKKAARARLEAHTALMHAHAKHASANAEHNMAEMEANEPNEAPTVGTGLGQGAPPEQASTMGPPGMA